MKELFDANHAMVPVKAEAREKIAIAVATTIFDNALFLETFFFIK